MNELKEDIRTEKEILHDIETQVEENEFTYKEFALWLIVIIAIFTGVMLWIIL